MPHRQHGPGTRLLLLLVGATFLGGALAGCTGSLFHDPGIQGTWGREFLSDSRYTSLIVEIDHQPGARPAESTVQRLEQTLNTFLRKPDGITIEIRPDIPDRPQGTKFSFAEIRAMEKEARDHHKAGSTAVLYIMFLNGGSDSDSGNSRVLGAAYSGSSVVMFKDNIAKARSSCLSDPLIGLGCPSVATIEDAVMTHEVGHILGLVNNGIPMQKAREDPDHRGHSSNPRSVMYWKVETGNIIDFLRNGNRIPNEFDEDDKADMRAAGGK